jgi:hypothetical protein
MLKQLGGRQMKTLRAEQRRERHGTGNGPVYTLDSFGDGIELGHASLGSPEDLLLALPDQRRNLKLRSRYSAVADNPLHQLERRLQKISQEGNLGTTKFYFGVAADPFHPFDGRFDASMRFLRLFARYRPGCLVIQTRSPLIVIALPVLKSLGDSLEIRIAVETCDESVAASLTPGLPRINERLSAASALRNFGFKVAMQVAPLLPYGDMKHDAAAFAEILVRYSDEIVLQPLVTDLSEEPRQDLIADALIRTGRTEWLRPDSHHHLYNVLHVLAPHKLASAHKEVETDQLSLRLL